MWLIYSTEVLQLFKTILEIWGVEKICRLNLLASVFENRWRQNNLFSLPQTCPDRSWCPTSLL